MKPRSKKSRSVSACCFSDRRHLGDRKFRAPGYHPGGRRRSTRPAGSTGGNCNWLGYDPESRPVRYQAAGGKADARGRRAHHLGCYMSSTRKACDPGGGTVERAAPLSHALRGLRVLAERVLLPAPRPIRTACNSPSSCWARLGSRVLMVARTTFIRTSQPHHERS